MARKSQRSEVFNKRKPIRNESRFVLNITVFSKPKTILSEIHLLSTPDSKRGKVFGKVSVTF